MHVSAAAGELDTVEMLYNRGCNPVACDRRKRTPLHYAAMGGFATARKLAARIGPQAIDVR